MKRRTFLLGMSTAAAGGSALLGSGAFSGVSPQRAAEVEVVGDDNAYLRLKYPDLSVECSNTVTLVEITNLSKEELTSFEIKNISVDGGTVENVQTPDSLTVGESGDVTAEVDCDGTETATVTFTVEATGSETSVRARERSNDIGCNCQSTTGISFVAFCGDVSESDIDCTVDAAADTVEWKNNGDGTIDDLVLYGGFGSYTSKGPYFLNFNDPPNSDGTVSVGEEDEKVQKDETSQEPSCPSPDQTNSGVKFEVADDGTVEKTESFNCS